MKIFLLCAFILLFILLVVVLPFKIKMCLHINYLNMEAYYLVSFMFISVICGKCSITDDGFLIENKTNYLFKKDEKTEYKGKLIQEYLKRIKVVNMNFYKTYGSDNNSMNTAMLCACENIIFDSINKYLKTKNTELNCYNHINPDFCESKNMLSVYGVIKISLLDVIISIISSKLKTRK